MTSCGSFDFARRLASLRMTLSLRRIRDPRARGDEVRILRLRSQARFARDDTALRDGVLPPTKNVGAGLFTAAGGSWDRWIPQEDIHARRSGKQLATRRLGPGRCH